MPRERGDAEELYILAGGGTGGHVFPAVAVARELLRQRPGARVLFVGTRGGMEAVIVPREGFPIEFLPASGFVGKGISGKLGALASLACGFLRARRLLAARAPRAVMSVGGYASLPVALASRGLGIPLLVEEQNAVPGLANRLAHRFADATVVGFASSASRFPGGAEWTGNPVRPEFFAVPPLGSSARPPRVLVLGGSQGARPINEALVAAAPALAGAGIAVEAQVGERNRAHLFSALSPYPRMTVHAFLERPWEALARADLVVGRAGAMAVAELAASGRPAILVPFAAATHAHQAANAREIEDAGAAVVLGEKELSGPELARRIVELSADPERLRRMGEAARALARPGAAGRIARRLVELGEAS